MPEPPKALEFFLGVTGFEMPKVSRLRNKIETRSNNNRKWEHTGGGVSLTMTRYSQQEPIAEGASHLTRAIKFSHKYLELMPCFAIGNYCDSPARMLSKSGWFDNMTALHRPQHHKDNRSILAAPHNMIFELFCVDSKHGITVMLTKG